MMGEAGRVVWTNARAEANPFDEARVGDFLLVARPVEREWRWSLMWRGASKSGPAPSRAEARAAAESAMGDLLDGALQALQRPAALRPPGPLAAAPEEPSRFGLLEFD